MRFQQERGYDVIESPRNVNRAVAVGLVLTVIGVVLPFLFLYGLGYVSFAPLLVGVGFTILGLGRSDKGSKQRTVAIVSLVVALSFGLFILYASRPVGVGAPVAPASSRASVLAVGSSRF